jgi:hypothetical protein
VIRRSLLYGMHRETAKPPKISLRLFDIWLTEYETGMLTIRKIYASSLALLRSQQILRWSRNSSNFMEPNIYHLSLAVCNHRMTKPLLFLPICFSQIVLIPLVFVTKIMQAFMCFLYLNLNFMCYTVYESFSIKTVLQD